MAITDKKISTTYAGRDIASLGDRPNEDGVSTNNLKARFDQLGKEVIPNFNALIDELNDVVLPTKQPLLVSATNIKTINGLPVIGSGNLVVGTNLTWKGVYSSVVNYVVGDLVSYATKTYACILASLDNLPTNTTYWSLFVDSGSISASDVVNTPSGNISSTTVQLALNELDTEKQALPTVEKVTPVDADMVVLLDSADTGKPKKWSWLNIKATLKTYFDGIYQAILTSGTTIKTINSTSVLGSGDIAVQPTLVSGTNIKTVNGASILASGDLSLATYTVYTVTIPSASWAGSSAPFSKAVTVSGILSTDEPIIDLVFTGTYATDVTMRENWSKIYRGITSANTITFYADSVPSADISIQIVVVR